MLSRIETLQQKSRFGRLGQAFAILKGVSSLRSRSFINRVWLSTLMTASLLFGPLFVSPAWAADLACREIYRTAAQDSASAQSKKPWFLKINFADAESTLRHGKIISVKDLKAALVESGKEASGTTVGMLLMTFANGTQAIWKPDQWNLAEVAAYDAARVVGSPLIPPTVERSLDADSFDPAVPAKITSELVGKKGSLQYFVKTPHDLLKMPVAERNALWEQIPDDLKAQRDIFNFVFGNWDLHWGNVLIDGSPAIVQIDNGVIRFRQMVRYGELPYVRRIDYSPSAKKSFNSSSNEAFPFETSIFLEKPTLLQFIAAVRDRAASKGLANYVKGRFKSFKTPDLEPDGIERLSEAFADLVRQGADQSVLEKFTQDYLHGFTPRDLTMRIAFWDQAVWIQAIGFQNYKPILPPVFRKDVLDAYRALTFETLRKIFREDTRNDQAIREMLERRDQILTAAKKASVDTKAK